MILQLTEAIKEAARECGYEAYSGFAHRLNSTIEILPAAWIEPAKLISHTGRKECRDTYRVTLTLITPEPADGEKGESAWDALEDDAGKITELLSGRSFVIYATMLKNLCVLGNLTEKGEISTTAEIEAEVIYLKE